MENNTNQQWDFNIKLESDEFDERSDYWQNQCNILYNMMQTELPSGSIKPSGYKAEVGETAEIITILSTLIISGVASKAFDKVIDKMVDILKIWQESRPKAKISLKYADGSEIELSNLSIQEAKKMMKEHQKKINKKI